MTDHVHCASLAELVTEYIEGAMTDADRAQLERHLQACPDCVAYVEQMRLTIRCCGSISTESVPPGVHTKLMAAFREWKRESPAS